MFETFIVASTTLFATIGPLDVTAMFAGLTANETAEHRRYMARRGVLISTAILIFFAFIGDALLSSLGISLAALKVAGGILLLLIGIEMVSKSATPADTEEHQDSKDISVFPLATPFIAGPGTMGAVILLMADTAGDPWSQTAVVAALVAILTLTFLLLILATQVQRLLGATGLHIITRVFGVLLSALAVQFIFDGLIDSSLIQSLIS